MEIGRLMIECDERAEAGNDGRDDRRRSYEPVTAGCRQSGGRRNVAESLPLLLIPRSARHHGVRAPRVAMRALFI
jgi:hypothetical protein